MHEQAMKLLLERLYQLKTSLKCTRINRVDATRRLSEITAVETSIVTEMAAISEEVAAMCAAANSDQKSS